MIDDESYLGAAVAVLDDLVVRLEAQGLARQAELARELRRRPSRAPAVRGRPPVLALLDDAFPVHGQRVAAPWDALRVLAAGLPWTRTGSYLDAPPNPGFLDRYSHATIIGPTDGDGPRAPRDEAALGVVLLGPGLVYPPHQHPADEVYLPLGTVAWKHDRDGDDRPEPAGRLVHHVSWQPHAMTVDEADPPVLLIYLWTGDVRTPAAWCC